MALKKKSGKGKENRPATRTEQRATPKPGALPVPAFPLSDAADKQFPIVGIGASAGGLAAFEAFFSGMPVADPGMAIVLVQHLAPDHKSVLTELIRRYTRMQVFEVEDGMEVTPNCAYIIPPNRDMAFLNGTLQLLEPSAPRGRRMPIDFFFRSLARVKQLSGLLPICASCKKIRDDKGYWTQIETYVRDHSDAEFSHGFCPECLRKLYPEYSNEE